MKPETDEIRLPVPLWVADDTEKWLTDNPLPATFTWPHRDCRADGTLNLQPVLPTYRLHKGYGFWLRTTPYFPGLFEEVHGILLGLRDDQVLPTPEALAIELETRRRGRGEQQKLFS